MQLYPSSPGIAERNSMALLASKPVTQQANGSQQLKVQASMGHYDFYHNTGGKQWQLPKDNVDGKFLSTRTAG